MNSKFFFNVTLLFNSAKYLTVFFYIIYSVLPSFYVLISNKLEEPVFFWLHLESSIQIRLAVFQLLGFLVLILTLPKSTNYSKFGELGVYIPVVMIKAIVVVLFLYTLFPFFEMLFRSRNVVGRVGLFFLSTVIAEKYKLRIVFLIISVLVAYLVFIRKKLLFLIYMLPIVSIEFISMGRVWPFAFFSIFLIGYLHIKSKFFPRSVLILIILIFGLYSMLRLRGQDANLDFLEAAVFLFGESFNTQQTIEIAISASNQLSIYDGIINLFSEFLPFGVKYIFIDSDKVAVTIIDNSKESLYGFTEMGFGSSWVSQYILYFGNNVFFIFYPIFLSLSLRLYLFICAKSYMFGFFYLYFYISGLFIFFRYGLNLSISYPLLNSFYCALMFLGLKFVLNITTSNDVKNY